MSQVVGPCGPDTPILSLSQWLNFKFCRITCLVGNIKFKLLSQDALAE